MAVEIRRAHSSNDREAIVRGASEFAAQVGRPDILPAPYSLEMERVVDKLLWTPGFVVLLAESDGEMVGAVGYWIGEYLMGIGKLEWQEVFWWCALGAPASAALRLLRAAKSAGVEAGCKVFSAHLLASSPPGVVKAYHRIGLRFTQSTFMGAA